MLKNKFAVLLLIALSFLAGIFLFNFSSSVETFAQRFMRSNTQFGNNWQYAVITRISVENPPPDRLDKFIGNVQITYFSYNNDRMLVKESYVRTECISHELIYGEFLRETDLKNSQQVQQMASSRAADLALAKAMFKLGGSGWEMVGRNFANFNFETMDGNSEFKNSIFFRRLFSQSQAVTQQ